MMLSNLFLKDILLNLHTFQRVKCTFVKKVSKENAINGVCSHCITVECMRSQKPWSLMGTIVFYNPLLALINTRLEFCFAKDHKRLCDIDLAI